MQELAASIKRRGVKTPISVRDNPKAAGRYLINHGARRKRAAIIAGLDRIPALIDNDYTRADQVVENLQREGLKPLELADYIHREVQSGRPKREIAHSLGKSQSFITRMLALRSMPPPVKQAFVDGKISDVTVAYELTKLYPLAPDVVSDWIAMNSTTLLRANLRELAEQVDQVNVATHSSPASSGATDLLDDDEQDGVGAVDDPVNETSADETPFKRGRVMVRHDDRLGRLVVTRRPKAVGHGWIRFEDTGEEVDVKLTSVELVSIVSA